MHLQTIKIFLDTLELPTIQQPLSQVAKIKLIETTKNSIEITLLFSIPIADIQAIFRTFIHESLSKQYSTIHFILKIEQKITAHAVQPSLKTLPNIQNIIAIASGKGGVGKSTTTVNLALALQQAGANTGILDADIYGPNQPHMLGSTELPKRHDQHFLPVERYGLQTMSIGYLIDVEQPMAWRGPMVSKALQQLLFETDWPKLDYLLIDMPPGTGDIQLTLAQKIPVSGSVIITTPQDIALLDARKGLEMFLKVNVNVLGIIENMSTHICSNCGHQEPLFGEQGAERLAKTCQVPMLGQLPLDISIRQAVDIGKPTVYSQPHSELASLYIKIARNMAIELNKQKRDYSQHFPDIQVSPK
ncbi:MAG: hypothetical protein A3F17_06315 [Gammaproteobacteria bacterium RIFCSPHIGHO2_12_FULL_41_15]|nr:MAG: hypothetical protein A3F17_06315 [Gammaproteobacteria bacterium RIFCSPHIGHO2_12_FULL_41_15]